MATRNQSVYGRLAHPQGTARTGSRGLYVPCVQQGASPWQSDNIHDGNKETTSSGMVQCRTNAVPALVWMRLGKLLPEDP